MSRVLPIVLDDHSVIATLDGRKTVIRKLIKPQPTYNQRDGFTWKDRAYGTDLPQTIKGAAYNLKCAAPYQPGDVLYVREAWSELSFGYMYKSDGENIDHLGNIIKWCPPINMPKEAARIWLKVKDVRVERLNDISSDDAVKEGTKETFPPLAVDEFRDLWNSTIKKSDFDRYSWDANPYVWVYEFERCKQPN